MLVSNLQKKQPQVPGKATVRSFTEFNDVVPVQTLASNEQRLSAHTTKDPVELVNLEFATHRHIETESTRLIAAIHMQISAFEIVKANYSHFTTTAYKNKWPTSHIQRRPRSSAQPCIQRKVK